MALFMNDPTAGLATKVSLPKFDFSQVPQQQDIQPPAYARQKPSVMGIIADALSGAAGRPGAYAQGLRDQGEQSQRVAMLQQQQAAQYARFVQEQEYKQAHPDPTNPHYFEDNTGNVLSVLPGQNPQMVYKDPNPWKLVPNGMGGVIPVNMQALGQGGASYGAPAPSGVTFTPIGGQTPPASGNFR